MKAIEFIRDAKRAEPHADKARLQALYVDAFGPKRLRSGFVGDGYVLNFSEANTKAFGGTAFSLSRLRPYDDIPFVVAVARPDRVEFLLSNSTFITKISHSSQKLSTDRIRGSINGSNILKSYGDIPNEPTRFAELFAIHESFSWEENIELLVEATNGIVPRKNPFAPSAAQRELLLAAPDRARRALATPGFAALEEEFQRRANERRNDILTAAKQDNGKLRGEAIERLLVDGPGSHALGDFETMVDGFHLVIDIKTKLLDRNSAPKANNVDKALEFMSRPDSVLAFLMVGIDTTRAKVSARLLPMLETSLVDAAKTVQHHWSGLNMRGTTQLSGDFHRVTADSYVPVVDDQKARQFIERLLAL